MAPKQAKAEEMLFEFNLEFPGDDQFSLEFDDDDLDGVMFELES